MHVRYRQGMAKDKAINVRLTEGLREQFKVSAARFGVGPGELLRLHILDVVEQHLRETDPALRLCVECEEIVRPGPDGSPAWHTHRGRIIGERKATA